MASTIYHKENRKTGGTCKNRADTHVQSANFEQVSPTASNVQLNYDTEIIKQQYKVAQERKITISNID